MPEFIHVKKFVRKSGEIGQKGELKISEEAIRISDIQTFRKWKPDREEADLLDKHEESHEMTSVTIAKGRDKSHQEKVLESFEKFGKRVGIVFLGESGG